MNLRLSLAAVFVMISGCGHVQGNYPKTAAKDSLGESLGDYVAVSGVGWFIAVGRQSDIAGKKMRREIIFRQMAAAIGQEEVDCLVEDAMRKHPFLSRLEEEVHSGTFYRGVVKMTDGKVLAFHTGDLLLTIDEGRDTVSVHDIGLVFISHKDPNQSIFTTDGPAEISNHFNGVPFYTPNRILVKSEIKGKVIGVKYCPRE